MPTVNVPKAIDSIVDRLNSVQNSMKYLRNANNKSKDVLKNLKTTGTALLAAGQKTKDEANRVLEQAVKNKDINPKTAKDITHGLGLHEGSLDWLWNFLKSLWNFITGHGWTTY